MHRSIKEDSKKKYFIIFQVLLYFLHIFEIYLNFWNYKRKWKIKTRTRAVLWPMAFGTLPSPARKMASVLARHNAVTTPRASTRQCGGVLTGDAVAAGQ
jgi:hypothetical protein